MIKVIEYAGKKYKQFKSDIPKVGELLYLENSKTIVEVIFDDQKEIYLYVRQIDAPMKVDVLTSCAYRTIVKEVIVRNDTYHYAIYRDDFEIRTSKMFKTKSELDNHLCNLPEEDILEYRTANAETIIG